MAFVEFRVAGLGFEEFSQGIQKVLSLKVPRNVIRI